MLTYVPLLNLKEQLDLSKYMTHLHFHEKDIDKPPTEPKAKQVDDAYDFDALAEDVAKQRGLVVVWPEKNQLQFDLDSKEELAEFYHRWHEFSERMEYGIEQHETQTQGHYHVTITMEHKFTEWERIALQAVLGSDTMREFLNAKRLFLNHTERPSRLFEKLPLVIEESLL